jgi:UDP-MurNAc hydroxylase
MRIKFISNACLEIISNRTRILCDPWLTEGAFDGSWWHSPPLKSQPEDFEEYTHLYVSHIHPDHCDPKSLRRLPNKKVPVILLKQAQSFLKRRIAACGFCNFIELSDEESVVLGDGTRVTMYQAFASNVFIEDANVPNIIDSSIVVECEGASVFNCNDNVPTPSACSRLRSNHGRFDLALLPYSGVGPFPSSYMNLTHAEKVQKAREKCDKYLHRLVQNVRILEPRLVVPVAGQVLLGGKMADKNKTIGIPDPKEVPAILAGESCTCVVMAEGDEINVSKDESNPLVFRAPHVTINIPEYLDRISQVRYWWEDAFNIEEEERVELTPLLQAARNRMAEYQSRWSFWTDWLVAVSVAENPQQVYAFSCAERGKVESRSRVELFAGNEKFLLVEVPYGYLLAILTRHCHWNNAYHGCIAEWYRRPDEYVPEIQTLLSFFHL